MAIAGGTGGGGKGAGDVRAGGGFFEIYAKDGLSGVLDKLKSKVMAFASFMKKVGTGLALGGAAGFGALFGSGVAKGSEINNLSRQLNVPIGLMSRLKEAADAAGVSVEEVMNDTTGKYSDLVNNAQGMDPEAIRQSAEATRALSAAWTSLQNAALSAGSALFPILQRGGEMIQGIVGSLRNADIENAFKVVTASAKVIWLEFLYELDRATSKWVQKMTGSVATLTDTFRSVPAALGVLTRDMARGFLNDTGAGRALRNALGKSAEDIDLAHALQTKGIMQEHSAMMASARTKESADLDEARAELRRVLGIAGVRLGGSALATQMRASVEAVKGGFGGSDLFQRFGLGDKAQQQTELLKQIAGNTDPAGVGKAVVGAMGMK